MRTKTRLDLDFVGYHSGRELGHSYPHIGKVRDRSLNARPTKVRQKQGLWTLEPGLKLSEVKLWCNDVPKKEDKKEFTPLSQLQPTISLQSVRSTGSNLRCVLDQRNIAKWRKPLKIMDKGFCKKNYLPEKVFARRQNWRFQPRRVCIRWAGGTNIPFRCNSLRRSNGIFNLTLLAPQSGAHKIAPHRDPNPNPTHPLPNPTYSSGAGKTHDVIYF